MNPPLPPSLREDAFSGNGKEIVYLPNGESQHNSTRFSFDEEFNSIVFVRFSVFINWLIDARVCMGCLPQFEWILIVRSGKSNEKRKRLRVHQNSSIPPLSFPYGGNYSIKKFHFSRARLSQEDGHLKYEIWKMVVFRRTSINEVQCAAAAASTICLATGWKRALDRDVTIVRHGNITIRV